jgi:glutamate--cysteine ligase
LRMSNVHKNYFLELYPPNEQRLAQFADQAAESLHQQEAIERADTMTFDQYLANYFRR